MRLRDSRLYSTSDTALAAWLITSDLKLHDIDKSDPANVVFRFVEPGDGVINNLTITWEAGKATGSISSYYRAYRYLLKQVKRGDNGEN